MHTAIKYFQWNVSDWQLGCRTVRWKPVDWGGCIVLAVLNKVESAELVMHWISFALQWILLWGFEFDSSRVNAEALPYNPDTSIAVIHHALCVCLCGTEKKQWTQFVQACCYALHRRHRVHFSKYAVCAACIDVCLWFVRLLFKAQLTLGPSLRPWPPGPLLADGSVPCCCSSPYKHSFHSDACIALPSDSCFVTLFLWEQGSW